MCVFIISVVVALLVSSFCSLLESVLLSLSQGQIADISQKYPKCGDIWTQFKRNIDKPISVILLVNTTAHTIGASVAGASFSNLWNGEGKEWVWLFSIVFTFLMLQYTEILPKTIGVRYNRRIAIWTARPLSYAIYLFSPAIKLIHWFNRPFEPKPSVSEKHSTVDEINLMATFARQHHLIGHQQELIIVGATKLSQMTVRDVMIPLEDVMMLSTSMTLWDAVEMAHVDGHTRFPVYLNDDKNNIFGYVNFKEIISHQRLNPHATEFYEIIRPIYTVKPDMPASDLLRRFTVRHEHISMVRDENDHYLGMVSMEDLVEELVGEIEDEFERLPQLVHRLPNNILIIGGGCPMSKLKQKIELIIPEAGLDQEPVFEETAIQNLNLTTWIKQHFLAHPKRGDHFSCGNLEFTIRRIRRQDVFDVQIQQKTRELVS